MRQTDVPAIILLAVNDSVTRIGEEPFAIQRTVLCWRVLDSLHVGAQQKAADNGAISTSVNQRHFLGELLRDTGFFAHLVFRLVHGVDSSDLFQGRDSCCNKSKFLKASQNAVPLRSRRFPKATIFGNSWPPIRGISICSSGIVGRGWLPSRADYRFRKGVL